MVSRVQTLRHATPGQRVVPTERAPGELYVNFPDKQIGFIDAQQRPQDLLPITFFSADALYDIDNYVLESGSIWRCVTPVIAPGAFNANDWEEIGAPAAVFTLGPPTATRLGGLFAELPNGQFVTGMDTTGHLRFLNYGSAALANIGASGDAVPKLDADNVWSGVQSFAVGMLQDAANIVWDGGVFQKAQVQLGASRAMSAMVGPVAGATYFLFVTQGAASCLLTWDRTAGQNGTWDFGAAGPPTLSTAPGQTDLLTFECLTLGGFTRPRFTGIVKGFAP